MELVFISDREDLTRQLYIEQPKSMLCRKLIRRFHESTSQYSEYNWLPDSFKSFWFYIQICYCCTHHIYQLFKNDILK